MPNIIFKPQPQVSFAVACETVQNNPRDACEYPQKKINIYIREKLKRCKIGNSLNSIIPGTDFSVLLINPNDIANTICSMLGDNGGGARGGTIYFDPVLQDYRQITIPEARRLCSFPDDFKMLGNFVTRWARLGNSVPPFLMRSIIAPVLDELRRVKTNTVVFKKRRTKTCAI